VRERGLALAWLKVSQADETVVEWVIGCQTLFFSGFR
jgi:hypothetical protein